MNISSGYIIVFLSFLLLSCTPDATQKVSKHELWHPISLSFEGPESSETAAVNPFTDYRLTVRFSQGDQSYLIRGFYAADGQAAETSAEAGNIWQVRFSPDATGTWTWEADLRQGEMIALSDEAEAGKSIPLAQSSGSFEVIPASPDAEGFRSQGRILKKGRYFRHQGSDAYFLKAGADSPENFLAYADFDGTQRGEGYVARKGESAPDEGLHTYEAHLADWKEGDPTWQNGKGKAIIGALNYLASTGMNSVYFLTMNIKGDGEDVWPYTGYSERMRFDCSKLDQWDLVFDHMEELGIMMHLVTQETENERLLDDGDTGPERQLYYRELIARFGHHLGLVWNLGEENGPADFSPDGQTTEQQQAMASYLKSHDPYNNTVVIHTHAAVAPQDEILTPLLGYTDLDGLSMQISQPPRVHETLLKWHKLAEEAGHGWLIGMDEIGMWHTGVMPDAVDPTHDTIRQEVLWGSLMAGAAGVEWYFGARYEGNDLACEDWHSRANMWDQTRYAKDVFAQLPYWEMQPHDELIQPDDAWCFAKADDAYLIYLRKDAQYPYQLTSSRTDFDNIQWTDPLTGEKQAATSEQVSTGGTGLQILAPPATGKDWVLLIN